MYFCQPIYFFEVVSCLPWVSTQQVENKKKALSGLHAADQNFQGRMCHKRGFIVSPLHPILSGWSQPRHFGDDSSFLCHWLDMVRRKGRIILIGNQDLWNEMKIEYVCLDHLTGVSHCQRITENKTPFRKKSELPSRPSHQALLTDKQTFLS